MTRAEYLSRPLIEGVEYTLTPDRVYVRCPHTIFIDVTPPILVSLSEALELVDALVTGTKTNDRVKIERVTEFRWELKDAHAQYECAAKRMQYLYNEILLDAQELQADGIHSGCVDDGLLRKIEENATLLSAHRYNGTPYSEFTDTYLRIARRLRLQEWEQLEPGETITYILK